MTQITLFSRIAVFLGVFFGMFLGAAIAATMPQAVDAGETVNTGKTRSRLIPAGDYVFLHLSPDDGWHTYWSNPGDSGLPTTLSFELPEGLTASDIHWPVPHRVIYGPLANFGYTGDVYLPVKLTGDLAEGTVIKARADWLVCEEICIPEGADLTVTMGGDVADNAALRAAVLATLPVDGPDSVFEVADQNIRMQVPWPPEGAMTPRNIAFFPHKDGLMDNAVEARWAINGDALTVVVARGLRPMPADFSGVVKVMDGDDAQGFTVHLTAGTVPAVALVGATGMAGGMAGNMAGDGLSFMQALAFAFIGGVILNLMPCVFPVLSMKAMALAQSGGAHPAARRKDGLAYTAGVLVSFAIVAGILLALRAGGAAIGWGFQLQSPIFVTIMAFVLFAMGLSFSGFFSVGGGVTGLGQELTEKKGHLGAFFTGGLATLVATPCTAPFMAGALGAALTLPPLMALPLFLMLGLGLAAPILLISFSPAFGRMLPKPGQWMVTFRQFLSFLLYATVVWLLWVLGRQIGVDGLALALFGLILISFIVWLLRDFTGHPNVSRWLRSGGSVAAAALLLLAVVSIAGTPVGGGRVSEEEASLAAEVYSVERLEQHLSEGSPVFVNFTADWCITCLANERVALSSSRVRDAFAANGVRYLKGDWTNRDAVITAALERFGRSGVPLYLYYAAGSDRNVVPQVLPQILTPGTILDVIEEGQPERQAQISDSKTSYGG